MFENRFELRLKIEKKDTGHNLPERTNFERRINRTDTRVVKALEVIFHTRDIATGWKILLE